MFRNISKSVSLATLIALVAIVAVVASYGSSQSGSAAQTTRGGAHTERPGLLFVDYRNLGGGPDGVALIDLDPESEHFGEIVQNVEIGVGVLPHHLYFNHDQSRLYTTALGGAHLYEILLHEGLPQISGIEAIDTGGNIVGEDLYFTRDGSRYYMTFMGGQGGDKGGSVGVFDAQTNALIKTILAPVPEDPASGQPFIMYAHGISANEDIGLLMVTSTIHPDLTTGVGNTVTLIDLETDEVLETYLVAESHEEASAPVEVLMLRDELPPYALATAMLSGDVWIAPYDESTRSYGEFQKAVEGDDFGLSWPLEFYIHTSQRGETELYISFAQPGVVNVYSLEDLPELTLKRTLPAAAGAHHMVFFSAPSGREVMVVQNNLLNLDGLNDGSLMVVDIDTGEVLATLDLAGEHGFMPESIESAYGHGHDYHH
jgi:DNA-binding beta-propeller fold protein YncE